MDFQDEDNETTQKKKILPARNPAYHLRQVYKNLAILGLNVVPGTWKDAQKDWSAYSIVTVLLSMRFGYALCQITDVI